jgi:hypothetical protein
MASPNHPKPNTNITQPEIVPSLPLCENKKKKKNLKKRGEKKRSKQTE